MDPSTRPFGSMTRLGPLLVVAGLAWLLSAALNGPAPTMAADPTPAPRPPVIRPPPSM